jgi:predicted ATPase
VPAGVAFRRLGRHHLRDVGDIVVHQVLHAGLRDDFPPLRGVSGGTHCVPAPMTSLIGRDDEVAGVRRLIGAHRLVTLAGPGGCGKTRLSVTVASALGSQFPDGVWFVPLASLHDGDELVGAAATALAVGPGMANVETLRDALGRRSLLLVLDNCEHMTADVATIVEALLAGCPHLRVLTTSREPIGVPGEAVYRTPSLSLPHVGAAMDEVAAAESVRLFVDRAALTGHDFALTTENAAAVAEVCRRLDGLPLAIELAAARTRVLPATELANRLEDRPDLISGGARTAPPRHQTLHAAIDWSFRLLTQTEQAVLARMSLFTGGADFDALAAICGVPDVVEIVTGLHDKSLVTVTERSGTAMVSLLETVRQFAAEKLAAEVGPVGREDLRNAHARWFANVADQLARGPVDGELAAWLTRIDADYPNLIAAGRRLAGHDPARAIRFFADLAMPVWYWPEAPTPYSVLRDLLGLELSAPPGDRAVLAMWLADAGLFSGLPADPVEFHKRAELLLREEVDETSRAVALPLVIFQRVFLEARGLAAEEVASAVAAADRMDPFFYGYRARFMLAQVSPPALAGALLTEAADVADARGHTRLGHHARASNAVTLAFSGRSELALAAARAALPVVLDDRALDPEKLCLLAFVEGEHGDLSLGLQLAEDIAARLGRRSLPALHLAAAWAVVGHLRRLVGDLDGAAIATERATGPLATIPLSFMNVLNTVTAAAVERSRRQFAAAADRLSKVISKPVGVSDDHMRAVEEAATLALDLGWITDAADFAATARLLRAEHSMPVSPARRPEVEALVAGTGEGGRVLAVSDVRLVLASIAN